MGTHPDDNFNTEDGRYAREDAGSARHAFRYGQPKTVVDMVTVSRITTNVPLKPSARETDMESRFSGPRYGDGDGERYAMSSSQYVQGEMERSVPMSRSSRHTQDDDLSLSSEEKTALVRRQRQHNQRYKFYSNQEEGPLPAATPADSLRKLQDH